MPSAMAFGSYGSTRMAASPATSGSDDTFDVTTGVPLAIASSGGGPKPSYGDGENNSPGDPQHNAGGSPGRGPDKPDVLVQLVLVHGAAQRGVLGDLVADQHQLQVIEPALVHDVERVDQPFEILVRLHVARIQHELVLQLIAIADADDVLLRGVDGE